MSRDSNGKERPRIAGWKAMWLELEKGRDYHWCRCGLSSDQPWCDGSHDGTGFKPLKFAVERTKRYPLCLCKQTADQPYCDGTHKSLRKSA